jgi:hypothetical protein
MNQANKDTFFYYFFRETGGRYDPALLTLTIEKLKEWLPNTIGYPDTDYSSGMNS